MSFKYECCTVSQLISFSCWIYVGFCTRLTHSFVCTHKSLCTNQRPIKIYRSQFLQTHLLPTDIFVHSKSGLMRFTSMFVKKERKRSLQRLVLTRSRRQELLSYRRRHRHHHHLRHCHRHRRQMKSCGRLHSLTTRTHKNLLISVVVIIFLSFASFHFVSSGRCLCAFDTFFASILNVVVCVAQWWICCAQFRSASQFHACVWV